MGLKTIEHHGSCESHLRGGRCSCGDTFFNTRTREFEGLPDFRLYVIGFPYRRRKDAIDKIARRHNLSNRALVSVGEEDLMRGIRAVSYIDVGCGDPLWEHTYINMQHRAKLQQWVKVEEHEICKPEEY